MTVWERIAISVNVLVPVLLFVFWLVAEWRWRRWIRLTLGVACMLYLCFQIWLTAVVADQQIGKHAMALSRVQRCLKENKVERVERALRAYQDELKRTDNAGEAALRMYLMLDERGPLAGE